MLCECKYHLGTRNGNTGEWLTMPQKAVSDLVTDGCEYAGGLTFFALYWVAI